MQLRFQVFDSLLNIDCLFELADGEMFHVWSF